MSFFDELKRRNVFKVGAAYVVLTWLLAQATDVFLENFGTPDWVIKTVLLLLVIGFPIALFFAWAFELTPEGLKKEKDVDRSQSITDQTGRKLDFAIIAILILALGYFAIDKFMLDPARDAARTEAVQADEAVSDAPESTEKSIAVLPFVNMSSDTEQEYFSDGISEEILNSLAKVKELKVAGRTSSFAFKGENQDLRRIGDALGVDHILEGSVRKSGATVRITAQLIQVEDGFHLWSETYDRELTDVFAIQDEIASAIIEQLKAQLLDGELQAVAATRTNSEAYDLYLLAKQRMYERTGPTIEAAADLLDRAIALDPGYAPAYAQRGIATLLLSDKGGSYGDIPFVQAQTQALLYLDKALKLDPGLAEGWAGLGLYYLNEPTGTEQAIEMLNKALALNPGLIDASNWLHNALMRSGKPSEARRIVMEMIERDPLYRPGIGNAVNRFNDFGEQEKARAHLGRVRPLIPSDAVIMSGEADIHLSLGEMAEGLALVEAAVALQPSNSVTRGNYSFALMDTHQYESVVELGESFMPVFALTFLGRTEEAALLAFKRAEERADISSLFAFLNITQRSNEVITYIEERWPDLDALQQDFPPYGALGYYLMLDVALAYSRAGQQENFDDAIERVRTVHEDLKSQGVSNSFFFLQEAAHQALAGDLKASLNYLDQSITLGLITTSRITLANPALEPLEGDPRYEAIQARMIEHLNREREKLGLERVTI